MLNFIRSAGAISQPILGTENGFVYYKIESENQPYVYYWYNGMYRRQQIDAYPREANHTKEEAEYVCEQHAKRLKKVVDEKMEQWIAEVIQSHKVIDSEPFSVP